MVVKTVLLCLLLAPLAGSLLNGLRWQREDVKKASLIGVGACLISFLSAVFLFFSTVQNSSPQVPYKVYSFFEWLNLESLKVSFSFLVDPLSVLMILVITGVGLLIHVFSVYYMSHDKRPAKYFSYLNLFLFSMMILVLGESLLLMFLGWEGVGLCSYLLIGFWFTDKQKALAGLKAFIVNRIGDTGFLIGMFILFQQFSSLSFGDLSSSVVAGHFDVMSVKWACFFLLVGALGKSAQIPLYIWLPSAMAGPTPVSALIHAATMVTAGIYLMVRMSFLFVQAGEVLTLVCWIGGVTAFLSALIACAQSDIKKTLAYSTISQLGYMFMAVGLSAFTAAMFHLVTHAFFKALLFLSAAVIIHALKGEQNIYRMGGLRKSLPWTYICFMMGFLALAGLPPFSGFFSKDAILWSALASDHFGIFSLAMLSALMTVFYMTRLFVLVFYGKSRFKAGVKPQEKGFCLKFPLVVLALLSCVGGVLGIPHLIGEWLPLHPPHFMEMYLKPVLVHNTFKGSYIAEIILMSGSTVLVLLVLGLVFWFYRHKVKWLYALKQKNQTVCKFFEEGLRVDVFCHSKIVQPFLSICYELWRGGDLKLIQGFIFLIQKWLVSLKNIFESWQKAYMQSYILFMILGLIVCILSVWIF